MKSILEIAPEDGQHHDKAPIGLSCFVPACVLPSLFWESPKAKWL